MDWFLVSIYLPIDPSICLSFYLSIYLSSNLKHTHTRFMSFLDYTIWYIYPLDSLTYGKTTPWTLRGGTTSSEAIFAMAAPSGTLRGTHSEWWKISLNIYQIYSCAGIDIDSLDIYIYIYIGFEKSILSISVQWEKIYYNAILNIYLYRCIHCNGS